MQWRRVETHVVEVPEMPARALLWECGPMCRHHKATRHPSPPTLRWMRAMRLAIGPLLSFPLLYLMMPLWSITRVKPSSSRVNASSATMGIARAIVLERVNIPEPGPSKIEIGIGSTFTPNARRSAGHPRIW